MKVVFWWGKAGMEERGRSQRFIFCDEHGFVPDCMVSTDFEGSFLFVGLGVKKGGVCWWAENRKTNVPLNRSSSMDSSTSITLKSSWLKSSVKCTSYSRCALLFSSISRRYPKKQSLTTQTTAETWNLSAGSQVKRQTIWSGQEKVDFASRTTLIFVPKNDTTNVPWHLSWQHCHCPKSVVLLLLPRLADRTSLHRNPPIPKIPWNPQNLPLFMLIFLIPWMASDICHFPRRDL